MTVPRLADATMAMIGEWIHSAFAGLDNSVASLEQRPYDGGITSGPSDMVAAAKALGLRSVHITAVMSGWSRCLAEATYQIDLVVDPDLAAADVIAEIERIAVDPHRQSLYKARATEAGLHRPLQRDAWGSLDHLMVDRSSLDALATLRGGWDGARSWLNDSVRRFLLMQDRRRIDDIRPALWIEGAVCRVALALTPTLSIADGVPGAGRDIRWSGRSISLPYALPETLIDALPEKPLAMVLAEPHLADRTIESVDIEVDDDSGERLSTIIVLVADDVRIADHPNLSGDRP